MSTTVEMFEHEGFNNDPNQPRDRDGMWITTTISILDFEVIYIDGGDIKAKWFGKDVDPGTTLNFANVMSSFKIAGTDDVTFYSEKGASLAGQTLAIPGNSSDKSNNNLSCDGWFGWTNPTCFNDCAQSLKIGDKIPEEPRPADTAVSPSPIVLGQGLNITLWLSRPASKYGATARLDVSPSAAVDLFPYSKPPWRIQFLPGSQRVSFTVGTQVVASPPPYIDFLFSTSAGTLSRQVPI